MYVGLDISKNEIVCVGTDRNGNVRLDRTFPTSKEGVGKLIGKTGKRNKFVLVASTHGMFVLDCLREVNADVVVANPSKMKLIYDSEKKTDRTDAKKLADLCRVGTVPQCHIPEEKTRKIRDTIRQRRGIDSYISEEL
jgi:transposase